MFIFNMKKYLVLAVAVLLVGCGEEPSGIDYSKKIVKVAKSGDFCGGVKNVKCATGLECSFNHKYPAVGGTCVESVVDGTLNCPAVQALVCGLKGRQKNGYLNECEAERYGAKVLGKGLCKVDESVVGLCAGVLRGVGNCETLHVGHEFMDGACEKLSVMGCEAEIPFLELEECERVCLGIEN